MTTPPLSPPAQLPVVYQGQWYEPPVVETTVVAPKRRHRRRNWAVLMGALVVALVARPNNTWEVLFWAVLILAFIGMCRLYFHVGLHSRRNPAARRDALLATTVILGAASRRRSSYPQVPPGAIMSMVQNENRRRHHHHSHHPHR